MKTVLKWHKKCQMTYKHTSTIIATDAKLILHCFCRFNYNNYKLKIDKK